jgi:predicted Zn-dependent protease with MMP-like domain
MSASDSPGARNRRRVSAAAVVSLSLGLTVVVLGEGFSTDGLIKVIEQLALGLLALAIVVAVGSLLAVRLGNWRSPASEEEFEEVVLNSERLATEGLAAEPSESEFEELDPLNDRDFAELVREALDDLPDLLVHALRHVPVVISNRGRRVGAYGLYQGGGLAHRDTHDRIVIFKDTLRRDFGHDPDLLRAEVHRVVRHELAHHVGFDEMGVRRLGL